MTVIVCGVDEAGRGPLAGPVYAAAVILRPRRRIKGLRDSKKLTAAQREELAGEIRERALAWAVAHATVEEIDRINILRASLLAMQRAVALLSVVPEVARVDGNQAPELACTVHTVVGGDDSDPAISAASILAKTERDRVMEALEARYPDYGFARHKGYATQDHLLALDRFGPCEIHRRSFAPVRIAMLRGRSLFDFDLLPEQPEVALASGAAQAFPLPSSGAQPAVPAAAAAQAPATQPPATEPVITPCVASAQAPVAASPSTDAPPAPAA
jgi:ribonuclease HII